MIRPIAAATAIVVVVAGTAWAGATAMSPPERTEQVAAGRVEGFAPLPDFGPQAAPEAVAPAVLPPLPQAPPGPPSQPTRASAETPRLNLSGDIPVAPAGADDLVLPPKPARLELRRVGIDMTVTDVGLEKDGSMELPDTASVAGWFRLGGNPGGGLREGQNSVIAAHVDDAVMGRGPFVTLRNSRPGDPVEVTLDDGSVRRYVVDRIEQTSKQKVDLEVVFGSPDGELVLVTCGRWDADVKHYEDNVLVWATPEGTR